METDPRLHFTHCLAREEGIREATKFIISQKLPKKERFDWFCCAMIEGKKEVAQALLNSTSSANSDDDLLSSLFLDPSEDIENEATEAPDFKSDIVPMLMKRIEENENFPASAFVDFAVSEGNDELIKLLLKKSILALAKKRGVCCSDDASVLLDAAITTGDDGSVASLLELGVRPTVKHLHTAVKKGCLQITESLLAAGTDINTQLQNETVKNGEDPLNNKFKFYKNRMASIPHCELLYPADPRHTRDSDSARTLLHVAAEKGCTKIVELLLEKGAEINASDYNDRTPLYVAVSNGHEEAVKLLRSHGAEIDCFDSDLQTPLHYFTLGGCVQEVSMLLKYGANVNAANCAGHTPLHLAGIFAQVEVAKILLRHGAKIDVQDRRGDTPLHTAVEGGSSDVVKFLLISGADKDSRNGLGETAFHVAAYGGHEAIIKMFVEHKVQVDILVCQVYPPEIEFRPRIAQGRSALHITAAEGHVKSAKILLKSGANIDQTDLNGRTALHIATEKGHNAIVNLLVDHGAKVDVKDENGSTAFLIALEHFDKRRGASCEDTSGSHLIITKTLLRFGADINSIDNLGRSPLSIAALRQWKPSGLKMLLEYGSPSHIVSEKVAHNLFAKVNESEESFFGYRYIQRTKWGGSLVPASKDEFVSTSEVLVRHVVKMRAARLYIGEEPLFAKEFCDQYKIEDFRGECEREVAKMKEEKVGESGISYYDILARNIHQLQSVLADETVVQILSYGECTESFPIFGNYIASQYEKAMLRRKFLEGIESFHFLLNRFHPVPYDIAEKIAANYLSNSDLRILMSLRIKTRSRSLTQGETEASCSV